MRGEDRGRLSSGRRRAAGRQTKRRRRRRSAPGRFVWRRAGSLSRRPGPARPAIVAAIPSPPDEGKTMNDYSKCDGAVITGLIEIVMTGINQGKLAEAEAVLAALRVLRPRFRELDTFDVWLLIKRRQYVEATQ